MTTPAHGRIYEFGAFRLDTAAQVLHCTAEGRTIPLTPRVYDTLLFLLEHPDELLDKRRLMSAIWPNLVVEENNLDQNISTLRHALGERRGENRYIVTVRGRGYRFVAPVSVGAPSALAVAHDAGSPPVIAEQAARAGPVPPPASHAPSRWRTHALAAVALAMAIAVITIALRPDDAAPPGPQAAKGLAVLPFRPLAPSDRNESLELGMAETLIMGLNSAGLTVRPLSAVRRFAGADQDAVLAGRSLGVAAVLEGHLQREGDRLRVSARLLDVADGRQLWAGRYDERFVDIFSVQDTIASRVRAALLPELAAAPPAALPRHTRDAEAYQLYVNGRFHRRRLTEDALYAAIDYFTRAIERDPSFASAYVGLAEAHSVLGVFGIAAPHDTFPAAQQALAKALELAPDLGEAYASLAHIKAQYELDWAGAERAYLRAIELDPSFAPAQEWFGLYLAYAGRFDEGLDRLRSAQSLEPGSPIYSALIGMVLTYDRRYDEAVAQLTRTLEMDAGLVTAHTYITLAHLRRGDYDEASRHLELIGSARTPGSVSYRGQLHALSGRRAEAIEEIDRLVALSRERYVSAYDIASIYAALGDNDQTLVWLERAFDDRSTLIGWLPWDEIFDGLRSDPRYVALVARLNVPQHATHGEVEAPRP
jgi:DNA-binding winged helix-turn-helix (wHTH) protein/TolB-like protein/tetratricopeptide (TPR) repeat protein